MAIKLVNSTFTDIYGNVSTQFKANAGDSIIVNHDYEVEISTVTSQQNQFTFDKLENKLSRGQGSFLSDGFRAGQTYALILVNNVNNVHETWTGTISFVSDLYMTISSMPNLNFTTATDYVCVLLSGSTYQSLNFAFNFIDNEVPKDATPSFESLIDQETSRFVVDGLNSMAVNSQKQLNQIGKKSGQFLIRNATITRLTDLTNPYTAFTSTRRRYRISLEVVFIGMFSPNSFVGQKCLKYISQSAFKVSSTDNLAPTIINYNEDASTGLWNEGFNSEQSNVLTSNGINRIFFNQNYDYYFSITAPTSLNITQFELGAMYYTLDDNFNKNKQQSQDDLLPLVLTGKIGVADIGNDWVSTTSKPFNIELVAYQINDSGGTRYYSFQIKFNTFYPNTNGFGKFVEDRGELDRQFYLWVKLGNTNVLIFDGQLEYEIPEGSPFIPETSNFINHDNNIDYKILTNLNNKSNDDFNLEDDIAHVCEFSLDSNDVNQAVNAKVVVIKLNDDFEFVLDKVSFDLTNVDLQYFTNQFLPVTNNLPNSSNKKEAFLIQKSALSEGVMKVRLYYPFLIDWRYWEEVISTHPYFVSQNKNNANWLNYQVLPFKIYVKTEIKRNGVIDYNYKALNFLNYDDWQGTSTIELFDATGAVAFSSIQENMTMMIKATHVFPSNYSGNPWGMITIEPKESSPRYIISTEIDRTQSDNPLQGIALAERCDIQYFSPTTIILRCYVNTNLLDGSNFCISSKISEDGQVNNNPEENKITEDNIDKITEDGSNVKIIE